VRQLASPPQEKRTVTPASYQTVTKSELATEGRMEWRSILCETNTTPTVVSDIQRALGRAGFNPGPIDGVIGRRTLAAVKAYQQAKGLSQGGLTQETLKSLGIMAGTR